MSFIKNFMNFRTEMANITYKSGKRNEHASKLANTAMNSLESNEQQNAVATSQFLTTA